MQVAMHSPGACVPFGSAAQRPVAESQLYMTGVGGGGVGGGVGGTTLQVSMQLPGACEPARSAAHLPTDESQL